LRHYVSYYLKMTSSSDNKHIVAITGANGFIGKSLVSALSRNSNISLRLLVRKHSDNILKSPNIEQVKGDLTKPESLKKFLTPGCTVINLAYSYNSTSEQNIAAVANLINICKEHQIKRLIHCSTAAVFGRVNNDVINENTLCNPRSEYGVTKLLIEDMFFKESKGNYEFVNLRPTAVFGADGQALIKLIMSLRKGNKILNYLRSCLFSTRKLNLVSVNNVTAAIVFVIQADADTINGETFIISEDNEPSNNFKYVEDYLHEKFVGDVYRLPRIKIPLIILSWLLRLLGRDSSNPYQVYDSQKIVDAGFKHVATLDSELSNFVAWYKSEMIEHNPNN